MAASVAFGLVAGLVATLVMTVLMVSMMKKGPDLARFMAARVPRGIPRRGPP